MKEIIHPDTLEIATSESGHKTLGQREARGHRSGKASVWAAGALAALMAVTGPALAQNHGGGGHVGGGAHMSGSHAGGGHMGGGGGHAFAGASRGPGMGGARGFASGARGFAGGAAHGFAGVRTPSGGVRSFSSVRPGGAFAATHNYPARSSFAGRSSFVSRPGFSGRPGFAGRPGFGGRPGWGRPGFGHGWGGGVWRGSFWPRVSYGWGFPLFLPVLPALYATYWWGGVPYYYANDVYYTYDGGQNGYVVTDPPPVAGTADDSSSGAGQAASGDVYAYPQNGQTDEQQSNDRYECHSWARTQTGYDPTHPNDTQGNAVDYKRAMTACLNARGYSAQ